jgi:hypothetical protein
MEENEGGEKLSGKKSKSAIVSQLTLAKAIELGEYDPEFLAQFPEWHKLTRHIQFEYVRTALDNRRKQLLTQWATIYNTLDYRLKPHLAAAADNVKMQLDKLRDDKERLYVEYSE